MSVIIEAGLDYISLHTPTWSSERPATIQEVLDAYSAFAAIGAPLPYKTLLGYAGYGDDHTFIGQRDDGYIRRISGAASDALFPQIYQYGDNPSRIDVQVTVRATGETNDAIRIHKDEAEAANLALPSSRRRLISEYSDNKGGMTVYVGSRNSTMFARIYNKYAQTQDERYLNCIRYEIELHNEAAHVWAAALHLSGERRHRTCVSYVKEWLIARGVASLIAQPKDRVIPPPIVAARPDRETTMRWLSKQVNPAVKRLLQEVPLESILAALGLGDAPDAITGIIRERKG